VVDGAQLASAIGDLWAGAAIPRAWRCIAASTTSGSSTSIDPRAHTGDLQVVAFGFRHRSSCDLRKHRETPDAPGSGTP
jgi:hypothetical protein